MSVSKVRTEGQSKFLMEEIYMKKRIITVAVAGILAVSMIAGCAAKSGTANEPNSYTRGAGDAHAQMTSGAVANDSVGFSKGYDYELADYEYEESFQDSGDLGTGSLNPAGDVNIDPSKGRLLIRTVSITAETTNYVEVASKVESQVKAFGGYVEFSSMSGTGNNRDLRTGTYTVRVPADKLDELIASVGSSCTVTASNEGTSDVTLEYVDTKARVESLRVEYDQLMELLSKAEDLDTIIILQNRLTDVRYQIESSESRVRVLENQVRYATLTLTLREVLEEKEVEEAHVVTYGERVMDQFESMWENTVEFFQDLLLGIIAIIPGLIFIAVVAAVVLIIVFSARKKRRARRAKALAAKEAEEKKKAEDSSEDKKNAKEDKKEEKKETSKE